MGFKHFNCATCSLRRNNQIIMMAAIFRTIFIKIRIFTRKRRNSTFSINSIYYTIELKISLLSVSVSQFVYEKMV